MTDLKKETAMPGQTETKILLSRERYRSVVDNQAEFICRFRPDTTLTFVNNAYASFFGKTPKDMIGTPFLSFIPEDGHWEILNFLKSFTPEENIKTSLHPVLQPDGSRGWQEWTDHALFDKKGDITEFQSLGRDLAEEKTDDQTLKDRLRFEQLLSRMSTDFINISADKVDKKIDDALSLLGTVLGVDRAFLFQFNLDKTELRIAHLWEAEGIQRDENVRGVVVKDHFPWVFEQLIPGKYIVISDVEKLQSMGAHIEYEYCRHIGIQAFIMIPVQVDKLPLCAIGLDSIRSKREWSEDVKGRLCLAGEIIANAIARRQGELRLKEAFEQIKMLKKKKEAENVYLQKKIKESCGNERIIGQSDAFRNVMSLAEEVAGTDATVLLTGETGTGKEVITRAIHSMSRRKEKILVQVNCAALPANLIESELFGREKGAYTGAMARQDGRFEIADGSTIFLDEIGELPLQLQSKLLRVLQSGEFERLGSSKTLKVNVRVIAATNRDLVRAVEEGAFRKDLYYRLNVYPITIPPLRERQEDILPLAWSFIKYFEKHLGKRVETISPSSIEGIMSYSWPGNVRELENIIERAMIISKEPKLKVEVPSAHVPDSGNNTSLEEVEKGHIMKVLNQTNWRIKGSNGAATLLGLPPSTLQSKIKKLGIERGIK